MKKLMFFLLIFFLLDCSNSESRKNDCVNEVTKKLMVNIPRNCQVVNYSTQSAIGDFSTYFELRFSKPTFDSLFMLIDSNLYSFDSSRNLYSFNTIGNRNEIVSITFSKVESTIFYYCRNE